MLNKYETLLKLEEIVHQTAFMLGIGELPLLAVISFAALKWQRKRGGELFKAAEEMGIKSLR